MTSALDRRLGPVDAGAIVVSNVIGGGIFFVPILVAQLVPDPRGMLLIFVAACAVMVVNELWRNRGTSAAGLAIIAAGSPIYWWMTADSRSALTSQQDPE